MGMGSKYRRLKAFLAASHACHSDSFVNSALYYLLTGRRGSWLFRGYTSAVVVCLHPHLKNGLLVFPELCKKSDYRLTVSVLSAITSGANEVQLARYSDEDLTKLRRKLDRLGSASSSSATIRVIEEQIMDWRYPIRIVDTRIVSEMKGQRFATIRNKYRRVSDRNVAGTLISHNNHSQPMLIAALRRWEETAIRRHNWTDDMSDFYHELFAVIETDPNSVRGFVFNSGLNPVGFTFWDEPLGHEVNLIANICDTTITGLSDFQLVTSCRQLFSEGIKRLNLGGSELESLDAFKAKFCPAESIQGRSAIISGSSLKLLEPVDIQTIVEPVCATLGFKY